MHRKSTENGQALILIAIALVAILGFAALAIDGGQTYSEKRRAQNAADAAAYAAARAGADDLDWLQAALDQVVLNDFNDTDWRPNPGAPVDVQVYNPPIDGPYSPGEIAAGDDPELYYQVKITQAVTKSFSQLVFSGDLQVSVTATARAQPIMAVSSGNAVHATNPSTCEGVLLNGGGDTWVDGGNIFSNSDKHSNCASAQQNGSGKVTVTNGGIQTVGSFQKVGGSGEVSPAPTEGVLRVTLQDVPEPDCTGMTPRDDSSHSLQPGIYEDGITIHNGTWTMAPGVYCLEDNFIVNGGSLTGKDVLIVMQDGSVDMAGNATIHLVRADSIYDSDHNQFGGMLFYMPEYNHGGIDLGGNSGTTFAGTIYAPSERDSNKLKCTIGGNSGMIGGTISITANIVCNTVQIYGSANVEIHYKAEQNYQLAKMLELTE